MEREGSCAVGGGGGLEARGAEFAEQVEALRGIFGEEEYLIAVAQLMQSQHHPVATVGRDSSGDSCRHHVHYKTMPNGDGLVSQPLTEGRDNYSNGTRQYSLDIGYHRDPDAAATSSVYGTSTVGRQRQKRYSTRVADIADAPMPRTRLLEEKAAKKKSWEPAGKLA